MCEVQPECCRRLMEVGWKFSYSDGFVSAEHPLGGKQTVVEVYGISRPGFEVDQIGKAIVALLTGGNDEQ